MNRNYKVIWNEALNCFTAVAEYAKGRSKSSSTVVSSSTNVSVNAITGGMRLLRLSALSAGLAAAGMGMSAVAENYPAGGGTVNGVNTADAIAIGNGAISGATGNRESIAIGAQAKASGDQSVALGANTIASGNSSVAVGGDDIDKIADNTVKNDTYQAITGVRLIRGNATGGSYRGTSGEGAGASAFGVQAYAKGDFSTALGMTSTAIGDASVALGVSSKATEKGALAIGAVSNASGVGSVALGINSKSSGLNSIAIGSGSTPTTGANSSGENATSIGSQSSAAASATAIGAGAKATQAGGVAIGTGSVANIAAGIKGFDPSTGGATDKTSNVWVSTRAAVALGDSATGITRQLTGLAAGTNESDAVNVAQLNTLTNQTFKIQANNDTASAVKSSDTVKFKNGNNVEITRSGNDITIGTSSTPSFTTVTSTGAMSAGSLNTTGSLTVTGTAALNGGASLNNKKLTGVAKGTDATDAVNFSQLAETELTSSVIAGNNTKVTSTVTGNNTAYTVNTEKSTVSTAVGSGLAVTGTTNTTDVTDYAIELDAASKASLGKANSAVQTISSTNGNLTVTRADNGVALGFVDAPTFAGQVKANGFDANGQKIVNVADGVALTDAANVGQLKDTANAATNTAPVVYTKADGTQVYKVGSEFFGNISGTGTAVAPADIITSVRNANGSTTTATKLSNVAAGNIAANSTDAVNGSQLNTISQGNKTLLGGAATVDTNGVVTSTNIGGTGATTIDGAISAANTQANKALTFTGNTGTTDQKLGSTLNIGGGATAASSNANVKTVVTNGNIDIQLVDAPTFAGQVKANGFDANSQKIVNVAAGSIKATSKDAVNGSQINTIVQGNKTLLGGAATVDTNGVVTSTNIGGTGATTIDGAISAANTQANKALTFTGNTGTTNRKLGETLAITGSGNLNTVSSAAGIAISMSDTPTFSKVSVTAAPSADTDATNKSYVDGTRTLVTSSNSSIKVTETASGTAKSFDLAINAQALSDSAQLPVVYTNAAGDKLYKQTNGSFNTSADGTGTTVATSDIVASIQAADGSTTSPSKLTNVAAGSITATSKDAVNGGQINIISQGNKTLLGGAATVDTNGVVTSTNIGGTGATTIDGAISAANTQANKALTFTGNTGTTDQKLGSTLNIGGGATAASSNANVKTVVTNGNIDIQLVDAPTFAGQVKANGFDANSQKIVNVKAGTDATDAVNVGQLKDAATGSVQYARDAITNAVNYNQVTLAGTPAVLGVNADGKSIVVSGGTKLSNVANGTVASDAVNKGQLDSVISANITDVIVTDANGDPITVNVTEQVVNTNLNNNPNSLFLTYDVEGQEVTDRLTIGETVQKMNTEGVKFAHTNAVAAPVVGAATNDSSAGGDNSTAIGVNAIITQNGESSVALGHNARVEGASSVAIGNGSQANGNQSIAIGTGNIVNGDNSGAFGDPNIIDGSNSYSVGNNNSIDSNSNDTFVLGNNVTQTVAGSVVLGTGSGAVTGAGEIGYLANIKDVNDAILLTKSTTGAVAVGYVDKLNSANNVFRQITGVAAGTQDSDAVNVAQLKAVSTSLTNANQALNDAAIQYDKEGDTVNKGSITLGGGTNGTTITNVKGGALTASSTEAVNGGQLFVTNQQVSQNTSDIGNLSNQINSGSVGLVKQDTATKAITVAASTGGTSVNMAGTDGDRTVSGVKAGAVNATSSEAINGSQLNAANATIANTLGGGSKVDDKGNITAPTYEIAGDKYNDVGSALKASDVASLTRFDSLNNRIDEAFGYTNDRIDSVERQANAGIAAALSLESAPYIPGKFTYSIGAGYHRGENAIGGSLRRTADSGRWSITGGVATDSDGGASGRIGLSGVIN